MSGRKRAILLASSDSRDRPASRSSWWTPRRVVDRGYTGTPTRRCSRCRKAPPPSRLGIRRSRRKGGQERHGEPGAPITEAEFDVAAFRDSYCRITVVDAAGRRAWGNPIWLQSASC